MFESIDHWVSSSGDGWVFVLVIAAILGLRHATDPDHLSALLTLRLNRQQSSPHYLGLFWGLGHAVTMIVVGIPLIFFLGELPTSVQSFLEFLVGLIIATLAATVLLRLLSISIDNHDHYHDGVIHEHPHVHDRLCSHHHRSNQGSFAIGLMHGAAGSAGVVALILSRMSSHWMASVSLIVIVVFTTISMAFCSWVICRGFDRSERIINTRRLAVVGSALTLIFGVWYALAAFEILPYPL